MEEITLPFIPYSRIQIVTLDILRKYHPSLELPIPVQEIVEFDCEFEIRGVFGLLRETGSPGALSLDQSIIFVDEKVLAYPNDHYYRFTLAHELGHKALHSKLYSSVHAISLDDIKKFYLELPEDQRKELEKQANNFAGLILVPTDHLKIAFQETENMIPKELQGQYFDETVTTYIQDYISKRFKVSPEVIRIRLEKENLYL